jgi:hypothetical protein
MDQYLFLRIIWSELPVAVGRLSIDAGMPSRVATLYTIMISVHIYTGGIFKTHAVASYIATASP